MDCTSFPSSRSFSFAKNSSDSSSTSCPRNSPWTWTSPYSSSEN
jgi:hypothetical protein